ncbi:MAG: ROK family transcriptional regulator [Pseudolysinimonas sp.]
MSTPSASGYATGRILRPSAKSLPEHSRSHNRALVLQTLYRSGTISRADLARATGLTRVTISDLVAQLIVDDLVVELGQRTPSSEHGARPGKPATLLDINRTGFQILGLDLSDHAVLRGSVLDLDGHILERREVDLENASGQSVVDKVVALTAELVAAASVPILGIGVGSPGVVDLGGTVISAPNLGWSDLPLQALLEQATGLPVIVANDANAAVLAEHSFGGALSDTMLVKIGHGVGAGLLLGGTPLFGNRFAAGEIGHVMVGTDGGELCACGKVGCLETWLAIPRLTAKLEATDDPAEREHILRLAGERLGIALAPVVGALDLAELVLSGPAELLDGPLTEAALDTLRNRTMAEFHGDLTVRMTALGQDIVMRGAAAMVLSGQLGVS